MIKHSTILTSITFSCFLIIGCSAAPDSSGTKLPTSSLSKTAQSKRVKLTTNDNNPEALLKLKSAIYALKNKEITKARKILLPLTKQDYADAYFYMAYTYMPQRFIGSNTKLSFDWKNGIPWLKKAADAGHAEAQLSISEWNVFGFPGYYDQPYGSTDWKDTYKYARMSANQGYAMGQSWLARILNDFGSLIAKSGIETNETQRNINIYMWYTLASKRYKPKSRKDTILDIRDKATKLNNMTRNQINRALNNVIVWEKQHKSSYKTMNPIELNPDQ